MANIARPSIPLPAASGNAARARAPARNQPSAGSGARIEALDGLRGILALMVLVSHYFGEVAHGFDGLMFAWIAIRMFFVLSGFLMARIILDNLNAGNFAATFYMRRACRTLPVYFVLLAIVFSAAVLFGDRAWMDAERIMPLWSFLTFTQGFVMVARGDFGTEWLTPTWTLTVEEQFYIAAPLICLFSPRRHLLKVLIGLATASIVFRAFAYETEMLPVTAALVLLPGAMHSMFFGMIAALAMRSRQIDWRQMDPLVRLAPLVCLILVFALKLVDGETRHTFEMIGVPLASAACAFYLIAIVRDVPEAQRLKSPLLRVFGRLSYSIYLLHMPVLGLMHGLILGARPDIGTPAQIAVTIIAVPIALMVAWVVNKTIEQPMINYGRRWKFKKGPERQPAPA